MLATDIPTPDPRTLDETSRPFAEAIADRYAIKRLIGRGGMGVVFLARDKRLDRLVAIKTLPPHLAKDPAIQERFLRETRTAGAMAHPNIVPIHGADEVDGHVYFVMTYVDGDSLAARVRAAGRIAPTTAAKHLRDVAAALSHAHARGIIHRDIKAENILIERATERALVTDFGIARLAEASPLTVTGQVLGTVHYVSPEQVSGEQIDARSDIYSLGVVGHFALCGSFPFDGDVASAILVQHVTRAAAPLASRQRDVPAALGAIVDRCLSKNPAHRFATAEDLLSALDAAIPTLGVSAPLISDTEAHQVWRRAAELQAATGVEPRPEIVARERDAQKDAARRAGFGLAEVKLAAQEAGIPEQYVEHALGEHGLVPGVSSSKPKSKAKTIVASASVARPNWLTGVSRYAIAEIEVKGELPARDVERLINVLRDATGSLGRTLAHTRELSWRTGGFGGRLEATVVPETGRTTIRVIGDSRRSMLWRGTSVLLTTAFVLGPLFAVVLFEGLGVPEEVGVMSAIAAGLVFAWKAGRAFIGRGHRAVAAQAERIGERLAAKVRSAIAE
jgi:serine/threonine-protein kinase